MEIKSDLMKMKFLLVFDRMDDLFDRYRDDYSDSELFDVIMAMHAWTSVHYHMRDIEMTRSEETANMERMYWNLKYEQCDDA